MNSIISHSFYEQFTMESSSLVAFFSVVVCLLHASYSEYGTLPEIPTTSKTICAQNIRERRAVCSYRNLEFVPKYLNPDILYLNLDNNNITVLYNTSFSKYTLLLCLRICYNDITYIESAALSPLHHLTNLILIGNYALHIPDSDIFRRSENLISLTLDWCSLPYFFPNDTMRWLPRLTTLSIQYSRLTFFNITHCPVGETPMWVSLAGSKIYFLTRENFRFPCKFHDLDLHDIPFHLVDPQVFKSLKFNTLITGIYFMEVSSMQMYLTRMLTGIAECSVESVIILFPWSGKFLLPLDIFTSLYHKNLSKLELTYNSLRLQADVFKGLAHVNQLKIFKTEIRYIDPLYFDGMFGLRVLDLSFNNIKCFNENTLWNLSITHLDVSNNCIRWIDKDAFAGLNNFLSLDFSHNPFSWIIDTSSFSTIRYLDFSSTGVSSANFDLPNLVNFSYSRRLKVQESHRGESFFKPSRFRKSLLLKRIQVDNSGIILTEIWSALTKESIFNGLYNIEFIDLSSNAFKSLPTGLFRNLSMLSYLNLTNCGIYVIEAGVLSDMKSLQVLQLDHNLISQLPHNFFQVDMNQLQLISLNSNLLEHLDVNLFANTPNVSTLNLSRNQLSVFNQDTFAPILPSLVSIDISENFIHCSCQMRWLIHILKSPIHVARANQTACSYDSDVPFRGKPLFEINPNDLCSSHVALFCTLPIAAVGLIGVVAFVYWKRWLVKYKIFLLKLAIFGYQEIQDPRDHIDYEFDLNVIHTDQDKEWVAELLGPILTDKLPQYERIAWSDEELPLGMYYLDAVLYVIEHSFKTILLLSRAATRDHEFMMKLRTALNHVTNTRTLSTLLVFLEDIEDEELPHLVKLYLSEERPYICWVEDERAQKYFWKKLIKMLKVNLRCDDMVPQE